MAHRSDNPVVGILHCPCGKQMKVRRNAVGRPGRCKRCRRILRADADALSPVPEGMAEQAARSAPGLDARTSAPGGSQPEWQEAPPPRVRDSDAASVVGDPGLDAEDPASSSSWDAEAAANSWDDDDEALFDVPLEDTNPGQTLPPSGADDDWIGEETPPVPLPVVDDAEEAAEGTTWDAVAPDLPDLDDDEDAAAEGTTWDAVAPPAEDDDWGEPLLNTAAAAKAPDTDEDLAWEPAASGEDDDDGWEPAAPPAPDDSWADTTVEALDDAGGRSDPAAATAPPSPPPSPAASAWDSLDDELSDMPDDDTMVGNTLADTPDARDDHMDEWYDGGSDTDPDFSSGPREQAWQRRRKSTRSHRRPSTAGRRTPHPETPRAQGKPRNAALIYPLSAITFGIYYLYWVYVVFSELRDHMPREKTLHPLVALLLHFAPLVNLIWPVFIPIRMVIEARDIQRLSGREPSGSPLGVGAALGFSAVTFFVSAALSSMGSDMVVYSFVGLLASAGMWWIGLAQAQSAVNTIYAE